MIKGKKISKLLCIFLVSLAVGGFFATGCFSSGEHVEETELATHPSEAADSVEEYAEDGETAYIRIREYIDQGNAKAALSTLLEAEEADTVYANLQAEDPNLLETVLVEAACFFNEDGQLYDLAQLRLKGFFSDEMFCRYWERVGTEIPAAIADDVNQKSYDVYLFHELLNWYERGDEAIAQIIDLRYLGMIDDVLYGALVESWNIDLMDAVDPENHIPMYGMRLSEEEKDQIRNWRICVDEGESRKAAQMVVNGVLSENVYRWLRKNDAALVDMIFAQAMFETAADGDYEQNVRFILGGFVSDDCFAQYWKLLEFIPAGDDRTSEKYPNADMYFVYEIERICALMNDVSLVQKLWKDNVIDEDTYDLLIGRVGGWESNDLEAQHG